MKKFVKVFICLSFLMTVCLTGCSKESGSDTIKGTYTAYITGYDWGCGVNKVVLNLDNKIDKVSKDDFTVSETKEATDYTSPTFEIKPTDFNRSVTKAYLSDAEGKETSDASQYVTLELAVDPNTGSPINYSVTSGYNSWCDPYELNISIAKGKKLTSEGVEVKKWTIEPKWEKKMTDADKYTIDSYKTKSGVKYDYAGYQAKDSDTLFVWLHGMGEGAGTKNTDPTVTVLANKVSAYVGKDFQKTLGNASVLVPQCPTYWMDADGKSSNRNGGGIQANGTSYYTESLKELIDHYQKEVGAKKVIIAGCSNGGYMTMLMAETYKDAFDAYVPICEALPDEMITDQNIQDMKDLNMFFIYSNDDTTVDPTKHEIPTIKRLKDAGAKNLHVSTTEHVIDTSGTYKDDQGQPHQYNGHWSWIYFDNNESKCDECQIAVWEWMAKQVK